MITTLTIGLIVNYLISRRTLQNGILSKFTKKELVKFAKSHNINITSSTPKKSIIKALYSHYNGLIKQGKITYMPIGDQKLKNLKLTGIKKYNLGDGHFAYSGKVTNLTSKKSQSFTINARNLKQLKKRILRKI